VPRRSETVTLKELAKRLCVQPRRVYELVDMGLERLPTGDFEYEPAFRFYISTKQAEERRKKPKGDDTRIESLRFRRSEAETRLAELELAKLEESFLPIETIDKVIGTVCDRLRARITNAPPKWAPQLVGIKSEPEALAIARKMTNELLDTLTDVASDLEVEAIATETPAA